MKKTLLLLLLASFPTTLLAIGHTRYVETAAGARSFPLVGPRGASPIIVDPADWPGVIRAVADLRDDIQRVTNLVPSVVGPDARRTEAMVLIGTIGKSPLIDQLVRDKKIDVASIQGKWESFFLQTVENPLPGIASALVIAGSDKRGTIYGIYDLSEQIGVSPWYWWADVTPEHKDALFIKAGKYQQGEPSVKYRGIFFNDEKPDLDYWVRAKYGERPSPVSATATIANFNSKFYGRVFEVILRMKGNYLWPAMWNNAFAEDDPENPRLADSESRGVVEKDKRLWVTVDWSRAPKGTASGEVKIAGAGGEVTVRVDGFNPSEVTRASLQGFAEGQGVVSIEPEHYTKKNDAGVNRWIRIEDYGRTLSGMRAEAPVDAGGATPGKDSASLEYRMYVFTPGAVTADLILSPTLNFVAGRGLRVAVSFDNEAPKVVDILPANYNAANGNRDWEESVRNNARTVSTTHTLTGAGYHTLKVWMVDPAVVVQKIVVSTQSAAKAPSYLGPPESFHH